MGTRVLAIALGPELVALVAGPADSPPDGPGHARGPRAGPVGVLAVLLGLGPLPDQVGRVDAHLLLEVLERVVGALGKRLEPGRVQVPTGQVGRRLREERARWQGVVWRVSVQRVGQHGGRPVGVRAAVPCVVRGGLPVSWVAAREAVWYVETRSLWVRALVVKVEALAVRGCG